MPIGWQRVLTQRGVIMIGRRSVRFRRISNDALPEPMTMAARNSVTATPWEASSAPTAWWLAHEVRRQVSTVVTEPAKVDDASHPGGCRRPRKVPRGGAVPLGEAALTGTHGVGEVVGDANALDRRRQRLRLQQIGGHQLRAWEAALEGASVPAREHELVAGRLQQDGNRPPT